jgi:hypothetical protein
VRAHLDPPGPPAFQEVVWLLGVNVMDDMDLGGGAGELSLDWNLVQPGHEGSTGRIPAAGTVAVAAPPAAPFPAPFPILLYNHLNCNPLERPLGLVLTLNDDDGLWGTDSSPLGLAVGAASGLFAAANAQFAYTVEVVVVPRPEYNELCEGVYLPPDQQPDPPTPPPPTTPPDPYEYEFDNNNVSIYAPDGTLLIQTTVNGPAHITHLPLSILVLGDDSVEIYNLLGDLLADVATGSPATVTPTDNILFISDTNSLELYSHQGQFLGTVPTTGQADLLMSNVIIIVDDDSVEIYDWNGNLIRSIPTDGRATVMVDGDRIIVIEEDSGGSSGMEGVKITEVAGA